jgi:hypothetical protein
MVTRDQAEEDTVIEEDTATEEGTMTEEEEVTVIRKMTETTGEEATTTLEEDMKTRVRLKTGEIRVTLEEVATKSVVAKIPTSKEQLAFLLTTDPEQVLPPLSFLSSETDRQSQRLPTLAWFT